MTDREDIIRMAREAGGRTEHIGIDIAWFEFMTESLERFAALVSAAERERIIALCKQHAEEYTTFYQHAAAGACEALAQAIEKRGK